MSAASGRFSDSIRSLISMPKPLPAPASDVTLALGLFKWLHLVDGQGIALPFSGQPIYFICQCCG